MAFRSTALPLMLRALAVALWLACFGTAARADLLYEFVSEPLRADTRYPTPPTGVMYDLPDPGVIGKVVTARIRVKKRQTRELDVQPSMVAWAAPDLVEAVITDGNRTLDLKNARFQLRLGDSGASVRASLDHGRGDDEMIEISPPITRTRYFSQEGRVTRKLWAVAKGTWKVREVPAEAPVTNPSACPIFDQMQVEAEGLSDLATSVERDDRFYDAVVADILSQGYNSAYARLGLSIDEAEFGNYLGSKASARSARTAIVASIRSKANWRLVLSYVGKTGDRGGETIDPRGIPVTRGAVDVSDASLAFFCSLDPAKMAPAWGDLYKAGYIDAQIYGAVAPRIALYDFLSVCRDAAVFVATDSVVSFVARWLAASRATALVLNNAQAVTLGAVAKSRVLFAPVELFGLVLRTESAEAVNAKFLAEWIADGRKASEWIPAWKLGTEVRTMTSHRSFRVYRVYTEGSTRLEGEWFTSESLVGMSPQRIKDLLSLPRLPTHVIEVQIPTDTTYLAGLAMGGGRQISVESASQILFLKDTVKSLPLP